MCTSAKAPARHEHNLAAILDASHNNSSMVIGQLYSALLSIFLYISICICMYCKYKYKYKSAILDASHNNSMASSTAAHFCELGCANARPFVRRADFQTHLSVPL